MSNLYFGKISKQFPQQYNDDFYAGGAQGSSWYNGLQVGDYVFPIYNGTVTKLWRAVAFNETPNSINKEGIVKFEVVKTFTQNFSTSKEFSRYRHFDLDLNLLNKSIKSTATEKAGFFQIHCASTCPPVEDIDLSELRNIYVALDKPYKPLLPKEKDLRILINDVEGLQIEDIQIYENNAFKRYDILYNLYIAKNAADKRYTLKELLVYAKQDQATKKEKFLKAVIDGLESDGYYSVSSPISLYDNILVGRKKSVSGKKIDKEEEEVLEDATQNSVEDFEAFKEYVDLLEFSPNLILYGPPGTGKTYSAQKIIEAFEYYRTKESIPFKQIQEEGRVEFVTFHQSFSYEEFVEGLRPVVNDENLDNAQENGAHLKYKVQDGILKELSNKANRSQLITETEDSNLNKVRDNSRVWKISLGERGSEDWLYDSCIENETIAIGWFGSNDLSSWSYDKIFSELSNDLAKGSPKPTNNANSINNFVNVIQEGDLVLVFNSVTTIRAIGVVDSPYEFWANSKNQYPHRRKVKWLKVFSKPVDILKYNSGKRLSMVTLYELSSIRFQDIKELLELDKPKKVEQAQKSVPYFLIIDEINRGNISKVFGELITLVEKDKRDMIKVTLPYSQKQFTLPANIYLIGTMNTADRSIAVLDTALRRRFIFKEIEPSSEVIRKDESGIIDDDLDLALLFEKLNNKIANKLDRDHRLGHSYFIDTYDLKQFRIVWYYQIIPLLMEYFYNDAESIAEIISSSFIDKNTSKINWIENNDQFKQALLNIK